MSRRIRRIAAWVTGAVIVGGLALVGVGVWQVLAPGTATASGPERRVVERVAEQLPAAPAAPPTRLEIPALDFEAPVATMSSEGQSILNPPTASDAYWLSDFGKPGVGTDNTVYVIGHASADQRAVFDPLVDRAAGRSSVLPGDEIIVRTETGAVVYEVVSTERREQSALAEWELLWSNVPGRLVLITCLFDATGSTVSDNVVVFARQQESSAEAVPST
ncbi:class F sortase [Leucobacter rhizosphaerae]|uniref:Class F sortase n=1 Tax=Leucobacter rhizosphaerae TaxID=2932245 RepID=A0ABY4FUD1_9MICO|nr:class F sortase [Leucobacter rhizosphaerae]UOQ59877.1 class F sortase [Leucobacter rhizosphaerae]